MFESASRLISVQERQGNYDIGIVRELNVER